MTDTVIYPDTGAVGEAGPVIAKLSDFDGDLGPWRWVEFDDGLTCFVPAAKLDDHCRKHPDEPFDAERGGCRGCFFEEYPTQRAYDQRDDPRI